MWWHTNAREGKWRENWRMALVASTLHTTSEHGVSTITTADAHNSAASSRLNWRPRRFKGLVRFAERRNLVSARVPSHFKRTLLQHNEMAPIKFLASQAISINLYKNLTTKDMMCYANIIPDSVSPRKSPQNTLIQRFHKHLLPQYHPQKKYR